MNPTTLHARRAGEVRRTPRIMLFAIFALTLAFCHSARAQQEDPVLGKTRLEWLAILKSHKESKFRRAAVIALRVFGPAKPGVMPGLIQALETDTDPVVRLDIASAIGQFGAEGKSGVDALAGRLQTDEDAKVRTASARSLGKLAEFASIHVMGLGRALKDKNADTRAAAAEALTNFGDKAKIVLPQLMDAARNDQNDVFTRLYAVQILGKQAGDDEKVPELLSKILADKDSPVNLRQAAAAALAVIGPGAAGAVGALADVCADRTLDKELRRSASLALSRIGIKSTPAWAKVAVNLEDPDIGIRSQTVRLAGVIGKGNPEISKMIVKALTREQNVEVLLALIQEAGELGIMDAAPELDRLVRNDLRTSIREAAEASLKKLKGS